jgi:uncharacterized protein (TIGR00730 family)
MKNITIYCGSSTGFNEIYSKTAEKVGQYFAENNITIIYGAGSVGLMGIAANACLKNNGKVIGVIPQFLMDLEVGHKELTQLFVTATMHERKTKMCEISEGIIVLPGGFGSMDELFEILTWSQLGLHEMPIGLLNINNFYDPLLLLIQKMVDEGFLKKENQALLIVDETIEGLIVKMNSSERPLASKWLGKA